VFKGQGHQATLVGSSSNYIIYMDDTIFNAIVQSEPLPVDHEYSRGAERCRRKACMGWSWAAACGAQGRGHIARLSAQLVTAQLQSTE